MSWYKGKPRHRRGAATLWLLAVLPVLIVLVLYVSELGHLWLARVELESSLESAAKAAVLGWGQSGGVPVSGWTSGARGRGLALATSNGLDTVPVTLDSNLGLFDGTVNPNENLANLPGVIGSAGGN